MVLKQLKLNVPFGENLNFVIFLWWFAILSVLTNMYCDSCGCILGSRSYKLNCCFHYSFQDLRHHVHLANGPHLTDAAWTCGWVHLPLQTLHPTDLRGTHEKNENSLNTASSSETTVITEDPSLRGRPRIVDPLYKLVYICHV
jgi:hypothetical protein